MGKISATARTLTATVMAMAIAASAEASSSGPGWHLGGSADRLTGSFANVSARTALAAIADVAGCQVVWSRGAGEELVALRLDGESTERAVERIVGHRSYTRVFRADGRAKEIRVGALEDTGASNPVPDETALTGASIAAPVMPDRASVAELDDVLHPVAMTMHPQHKQPRVGRWTPRLLLARAKRRETR